MHMHMHTCTCTHACTRTYTHTLLQAANISIDTAYCMADSIYWQLMVGSQAAEMQVCVCVLWCVGDWQLMVGSQAAEMQVCAPCGHVFFWGRAGLHKCRCMCVLCLSWAKEVSVHAGLWATDGRPVCLCTVRACVVRKGRQSALVSLTRRTCHAHSKKCQLLLFWVTGGCKEGARDQRSRS